MKVTVYNIKTGEAATIHGVDAMERIAAGGWSFDRLPVKPIVKRKRKTPVKKPLSKKVK